MAHETFQKIMPFCGALFIQAGFAVMEIITMFALQHGMSSFVNVAYRHAVALIVIAPFAIILDKRTRPKMTFRIFTNLVMLSLLEPVVGQNLYFLGMKYTTATFATVLSNILPAITFLMAWVLRLENIQIWNTRSQAKLIGTASTVGGAMLMTLVKGPLIHLFWTKGRGHAVANGVGGENHQHSVKGSVMIIVGCLSWALFMNLQAIAMKTYPSELSLTAWICLLGTIVDVLVALVMERGNPSAWAISWDSKLLAAVYSGVVCSGLTYYLQGLIMKVRGPVFVTAFSPLNLVIVAILSTFMLGEQMYWGRVIGAIVIVAGLYLVLWGKSKDQSSVPDNIPITKEGNQISYDEEMETGT